MGVLLRSIPPAVSTPRCIRSILPKKLSGSYEDSRGIHGYLFSNGNYIDIDVPDAFYTFATGNNTAGEIVGLYLDSSEVWHGFLLSNGRFIPFNDPDGIWWTWPTAINQAKEIVGWFYDGVSSHGFLVNSIGK